MRDAFSHYLVPVIAFLFNAYPPPFHHTTYILNASASLASRRRSARFSWGAGETHVSPPPRPATVIIDRITADRNLRTSRCYTGYRWLATVRFSLYHKRPRFYRPLTLVPGYRTAVPTFSSRELHYHLYWHRYRLLTPAARLYRAS